MTIPRLATIGVLALAVSGAGAQQLLEITVEAIDTDEGSRLSARMVLDPEQPIVNGIASPVYSELKVAGQSGPFNTGVTITSTDPLLFLDAGQFQYVPGSQVLLLNWHLGVVDSGVATTGVVELSYPVDPGAFFPGITALPTDPDAYASTGDSIVSYDAILPGMPLTSGTAFWSQADGSFISGSFTVSVRHIDPPAPEPGCTADLAEPFGVLNFDDVLAFLTAFGAGCP